MQEFILESDYIPLCDLLKAMSLADSGGQAKMFIANGEVLLNAQVETRKTKKIKTGDIISFKQIEILVK